MYRKLKGMPLWHVARAALRQAEGGSHIQQHAATCSSGASTRLRPYTCTTWMLQENGSLGRRCCHGAALLQAAGKDSGTAKPSQGALLSATRGRQKPRVVILGTGWGACRLLKDINTVIYDVVCISPRNHMVFTPLLASTCVGTLEFRSVAEPVRSIQPALSLSPDSFYFPARCTSIDPDKHEVRLSALPSNAWILVTR